MRIKINRKMVSLEKEVYDRVVKDRKHFQEVIGGGKWSISDTIQEYIKIINTQK